MRWIALLSIVIICGCSTGNQSQHATVVRQSKTREVTSTVPVIIEAKIVGGGKGSKYYWYDIEPTKVIKNSIGVKLDSQKKVAIQNDMPEIKVGTTYVLDLVYYNESHPEYGMKIVSSKRK